MKGGLFDKEPYQRLEMTRSYALHSGMSSTETALREWRYGSTQAERLAAGILRLEKYTNIQPQAPIGGGDGGADILCERGRHRWVCAVYFPTTEKTFGAVTEKFRSDLQKARAHSRNGFIFITNQRLTRGERQALSNIAAAASHESEIYDVERIGGALDSPEGYGLRITYLRIPMTPDEQVAFFANRENQLVDLVSEQSLHMQTVLHHLAQIRSNQANAFHTMEVMARAQNIPVEPLRAFDPLAVGEITADPGEALLSESLTPEVTRIIHRLVCFDLPSRKIGHFRTVNVVITKSSSAPADPTISPPVPNEIPRLMDALCSTWRGDIKIAQSDDTKLAAVAKVFHGLIAIHPFLDGNGRVARSILMQLCLESFGHVDMSRLDRGVEYFAALQAGDGGDFQPLKSLIQRTIAD